MWYYPWAPLSILLVSVRMSEAKAYEVAEVVTRAAQLEGMEEHASVAAVFVDRETGGTKVRGDHGLACGWLQEHEQARRGWSCEDVEDSPELAVRTWLQDLRELIVLCGSTKAALGVLATGKCGGAPRLVAERCEAAGGCF